MKIEPLDQTVQARLSEVADGLLDRIPADLRGGSQVIGAVLALTYDDSATVLLVTVDPEMRCIREGAVEIDPITAVLEGARDAIDERIQSEKS